jgi:hypothetical protein
MAEEQPVQQQPALTQVARPLSLMSVAFKLYYP